MQTGETLLSNEGIVLTTCKTPNSLSRIVNIFPENHKGGFGAKMPPSVNCTQEGTLAVIKLEAGKYYTGYTPDLRVFKHLPQFTVQPNKVNYIGDLRIAVRETNVVTGLLVGFDRPQVNVSVMDKSEETLQRLKDERPDIADKYEIVTDIATR